MEKISVAFENKTKANSLLDIIAYLIQQMGLPTDTDIRTRILRTNNTEEDKALMLFALPLE